MWVGGEAWRAASFTRRYSVENITAKSHLKTEVIPMNPVKKIKCVKCEHYFAAPNGVEYCIKQATAKRIFAYFMGETDEPPPKLIPPRWRCRDFKKRNDFNPYISG